MMMRFLGRSLVPPAQFCDSGLALLRGFGLTMLVYPLCWIFGGLEAGLVAWYLFIAFLALDALNAGILKLHNYLGNFTVKRDFDKSTLILANAMPYTLEGNSGTAILFIHGFGDTPETWQLIAPRVHSLANATCHAMRLPFVATPLSQQHHAHLGDWLVAIREEMENLRRCHKKVFIAGHGLGAGLALLATRDNPKLADGVVALSPLVHAKRTSKILFWLADHFCVFTRVVPNPFRSVIKTQDGRVYSYVREHFTAFAMFRAIFLMTRRLGETGRRHTLPVLAFVSLRDRMIDIPATTRFLGNTDIFADADFYTTRKAGHVLTLDEGWEKRAKRIAAFVSRYGLHDEQQTTGKLTP